MIARGQITIHNVRDGESAEFYRLKVVREEAVVNGEGVLNGAFSYSIEYVKGSTVTTKEGKKPELYVACKTNTNVDVPITAGSVNSVTFYLSEYVKSKNRPDFFIVELKKGDEVLETRNVQVMMEAASYTKIVNDMRETVSTNGKAITRIKQDANSIKLIAEGLRTGVRNLLTGGKVEKSFNSYGYADGRVFVKLKTNTTYTLTVSGHISAEAVAKGQTLQAYIIADGWAWSAGGGNLEINTTHDVIKHYTFTTPETLPNDGVCNFDAYPIPNQMPHSTNGEVTVNWAVVTEGTAPAAEWIPSAEESSDEQIKRVEAKLENGEFKVKSNTTMFADNTGKEIVLIRDGKMSAELIDAVKIVALGIKAQEIDAKNATIRNLIVEGNSLFKGRLKGASGSFTSLDCVNDKGEVVCGMSFSSDGRMTFDGDILSQGTKEVNGRKRSLRYYSSDIWCRGQLGHYSRICAEVKDNMMFVHHSGHEDTTGVKVKLGSITLANGQKAYYVPLFSPGANGTTIGNGTVVDYDNPKIKERYSNRYDIESAEVKELPSGAPIDMVIFNCTQWNTYCFVGMGYGKQWTVINGNDNQSVNICVHGSTFQVHGGYVLDCCYVNPAWLSPAIDATGFGAGVMMGRELDMNWG